MGYRECSFCGEPTYHQYDLCKECYKHKKKRDRDSQERQHNQKYKNGKGFLSHTELYENLFEMELLILDWIFDSFDFKFDQEKAFMRKKKTTTFDVEIEEGNWDLVFKIRDTPEKSFKDNGENKYMEPFIYVEYKSSIDEWGKQIDSFIRQIKKRMNKYRDDIHVLLSFDERFSKYEHALQTANIYLVIIPIEIVKDYLNHMKKSEKNIHD